MQCFKWGVSEKEGKGPETATQERGRAGAKCFVEIVLGCSSSSFRLKFKQCPRNAHTQHGKLKRPLNVGLYWLWLCLWWACCSRRGTSCSCGSTIFLFWASSSLSQVGFKLIAALRMTLTFWSLCWEQRRATNLCNSRAHPQGFEHSGQLSSTNWVVALVMANFTYRRGKIFFFWWD